MTERTDRAQSITVNYTLGLGIALVLSTGLLIAGANFVTDQREQAARTELQVVGQQVAADVEATDRLVNASERDTRVRVTRDLPSNIAGANYEVTLVEQADPYLRLATENPEETVRIEFTNQTSVSQSSASGGELSVNYTDGSLQLEPGGGVSE